MEQRDSGSCGRFLLRRPRICGQLFELWSKAEQYHARCFARRCMCNCGNHINGPVRNEWRGAGRAAAWAPGMSWCSRSHGVAVRGARSCCRSHIHHLALLLDDCRLVLFWRCRHWHCRFSARLLGRCCAGICSSSWDLLPPTLLAAGSGGLCSGLRGYGGRAAGAQATLCKLGAAAACRLLRLLRRSGTAGLLAVIDMCDHGSCRLRARLRPRQQPQSSPAASSAAAPGFAEERRYPARQIAKTFAKWQSDSLQAGLQFQRKDQNPDGCFLEQTLEPLQAAPDALHSRPDTKDSATSYRVCCLAGCSCRPN